MFTVVAQLKVQPDKVQEFEQVFKIMTAAVRAGEPDVIFYQLNRSPSASGSYVVVEVYKDAAAFEHHKAQDHFKSNFGKILPWLAEPPARMEPVE